MAMRDFKKGRSPRSRLRQALLGLATLCALGLVTVLLGHAAWDMYGKFVKASDASAAAESQAAQLRSQLSLVSGQVESLSTERGIERELRQRYGVAKPGEGQIDIVRPAPQGQEGSAVSDSLWGRIWHALFVW